MNSNLEAVERFGAIGEALHWVRVTQLQVERFVESFLTEAEADPPQSFIRTTADAHFLLNAAAQMEKAVRYVEQTLPAERSLTIRALRDVHEHWEQHKESFASPKFSKRRAGQRFAEAHPDAVPWNFSFGSDGTWISVLRLEDLWTELQALERELGERLAAVAADAGVPAPPLTFTERPFPRRESKVLAMSMLTQNIVIDFDG